MPAGVDRELAGGGLIDPRTLKAFEALLSWIDTGWYPWVHGDLSPKRQATEVPKGTNVLFLGVG